MSIKNFGAKTTALEVIEGHDLTGYEIIVTGAASGIGVETVRAFAKANARIILAARDLTKAHQVANEIIKSTGNDKVEVEELDLASLKSVKAFVDRFNTKNRHLNILVNNAGIMACPLSYTEDGFELQFGTNHIGHFALFKGLVTALEEAFKKTGRYSRVVSLSSSAHARSDIDFDDINFKTRIYDPWISYGQSKTANSLFSVELTKRYRDRGILSNAVMPGVILTGLQKYISKEEQIKRGWIDEQGNFINNPLFKTIEQGASTTVWAAVSHEFENKGGLYLDDCSVSTLKESLAEIFKDFTGYLAHAINPENAAKLWDLSEKWIENPPI